MQETAAREIRKNTDYDEAARAKMFETNGYSIDNLMKDIRFKLGTFLAEAGL